MALLFTLIDIYSLLVLAEVVVSWIPEARDNRFGRFLERVTEPPLAAIRAVLPPMGGLDLSPMLLLLGLQLLKRLLR